MLEEALAASKARERKAREDSALEQERHSQDLVDLGQGRSKALRDLLAKYEEAKRGKVEAELQLSHAVEKIEELTEWKQMNSSRAIWDAVEAEQQQARAEEAMTMKDMASMLEVGACTYVRKLFRVGECVCVCVFVFIFLHTYRLVARTSVSWPRRQRKSAARFLDQAQRWPRPAAVCTRTKAGCDYPTNALNSRS